MTQFDFGNIDPDTTSGTDLSESILEPWRDALHSCHKGSTRPSYAGQGLMWIDDSATPWLIKVYTGSTDSIIGSIAPSTGVFNVRSDVISEASSGTGVTVDGVLLKDGAVTTDTINEDTADAGVTIDGVLLKDGGGAAAMTSAGGNFPNVDADVTATDEELNSTFNAQNNGPMYTGWVDVSVPEIINGPSGWTVSKNGTGEYAINHGLGLSDVTNLIFIGGNAHSSASLVKYNAFTVGGSDSNNAEISIFRVTDGNLVDADFSFAFFNTEEA